MAESFVGEIRMFGGNFAPRDWSMCDGSLMSISQNDVLFALIGTTYGGDGQQTYALPDLRGRIPLHQGQGPGLTTRIIGESSGSETVTVLTGQLPAHSHINIAETSPGTVSNPDGQLLAKAQNDVYSNDLSTPAPMNPQVLTQAGGNQPHENMMPFLAVSFIISLYGVFPTQG